jgi:HD-GYP domain-containing protein (c-di-GMP phosphodiesterase class II)
MVRTRRFKVHLYSLIIPLFLFLSPYAAERVLAAPLKPAPAAVEGVLDLRQWDFQKDGAIELNGQWNFFWNAFLPPNTFSRGESPAAGGFMNLPGYWNDIAADGAVLPGQGYATLHLKLLIPVKDRPFAVKIKEIQTAYSLFLDGKELLKVGRPGTDAESSVPRFASRVAAFLPADQEIHIVLHISNFHHRKGGIWESIRFGLEEDVRKGHENKLNFEIFLTGSIIIMGLYHLGFYLLRRQDRPALFFGLFCCLIALRTLTTGELHMYRMFPGIPWKYIHRMEYISYYLALPFFMTYLYSLFPRLFSTRVLHSLSVLAGGFTLFVLFTPARIYSHSVQPYQIITILLGIYSIYVLIRAVIEKEQSAVILGLGFLVMFAAVINDVLHSNQFVHTGFFMPLGLFIFIFSQAYLIARRFTIMFTTVERSRIAIILGLAKLAEYRDLDTGTHLERIREYSKILAGELARNPNYKGYITGRYIEDLFHSSILHDIGKVGVPDSILLKPAGLTSEEFESIKRHVTIGGDSIREIEAKMNMKSFLTLGKEIAYYHHEKWDGSGYPKGLKGQDIPLSARIVALADVYDALTSERPYKKAMSHEKAAAIILEGRGTHFDPLMVDIFSAQKAAFDEVRRSYQEAPVPGDGSRD